MGIRHPFFLTVVGNNWQVFYSLNRCTPLHKQRECGGTVQLSRILWFPPLYVKAQGMNTRLELFKKRAVAPYPLDVMTEDLIGNPNMAHFLPAVIASVNVSLLLPTHPKIAALFLKGPTIVDGFKIRVQLHTMIPANSDAKKQLLANH
jgi:hypothetical protein